MKPLRLLFLFFLIFCALLLPLIICAQPSGVVTKTATHATLSAVTFPPPARPAPVIAADVISDKATARLAIQYGDGARHVALSNAANNATTLYLSGTSLASNAVLLHVSGVTVTSMTVASNALPRTNAVLELHNPVGFEVATTATAREVTSSSSLIVQPHAATSNLLWLDTTNGWAADMVALIEGPPGSYQTGVVATVSTITNSGVIYGQMTFDEALLVAVNEGGRVWQLTTNLYTVARTSTESTNVVTLSAASGLAAGDFLWISTADGSNTVRQISTAPALEYFLRADLSAATGVTVAAGDVLYAVSSTFSSLVGAATVRLVPTAWTIPQACPARIYLDGTSACTINAVSVDYGP